MPDLFSVPFPAPRTSGSQRAIRALDRSILVVEDECTVRTVMHHVLTEDGYRVMSAANAEDALEIIRDSRFTPDAVIADVVLPGMHGAEFARQALLLRPSLRVLLMSGYAPPTLMLGSESVPMLQKPFGHRALQVALNALFATA